MMMKGMLTKRKERKINNDSEFYRSSNTSIGGRSQPLRNPNLNDLDYQILDVHDKLKNRPVFA